MVRCSDCGKVLNHYRLGHTEHVARRILLHKYKISTQVSRNIFLLTSAARRVAQRHMIRVGRRRCVASLQMWSSLYAAATADARLLTPNVGQILKLYRQSDIVRRRRVHVFSLVGDLCCVAHLTYSKVSAWDRISNKHEVGDRFQNGLHWRRRLTCYQLSLLDFSNLICFVVTFPNFNWIFLVKCQFCWTPCWRFRRILLSARYKL